MREHPQVLLEDVYEVIAGPSGHLLDALHDGPEGVPVIGPQNLANDHSIDARNLRRIPDEKARKLARFAVQSGDLIIVRQGALGRLAIVGQAQESWLFGASCLRLRANDTRVYPHFLAWYLSGPFAQNRLQQLASAGTIPAFNVAALKNMEIPVPPVEDQQTIIAILQAAQTQAKLHREAARRLEELCPSLFIELLARTRR
ncbi:restriction endonuclease subunit S [Nonomuraea sp. K274]|uniref:Restriction endonuclease subunit S n=1 Tax=Nonomuraea cypriaca TaxID=1187855 RepID=A0A931A7P2_9ACTN|nr:restriction endonuclease subunit S [Nonomuraea cypriaca]MBF8184900.1 restriction endonuclease subunit S [Nonomuraea cypriaca]